MAEGHIPLLTVRARTLPLAWEKAVLLCWAKGASVCTEYDRVGDPPSRDCTMAITVTAPLAEPRIHRAFPGSLEDLEIYRQEVVNGIHDHWISPITWNPQIDPPTNDPPCLQRIWCRLIPGRSGLVLNMNAHWRSRDAYKAAFMNMFALTDLQRYIAENLAARLGQKIRIGRYVDISDSFHIYGSYAQEFQQFLHTTQERTFSES